MKKLLLSIIFSLISINASAQAFVQHATPVHWFGGAGTTETIQLTSVVAGHLITLGAVWATPASTISAVSCSGATLIDHTTDSTTGAESDYYIPNSGSGTISCQFTWSADPGSGTLLMDEISGIATSTPLDVHSIVVDVSPGTGTDAVLATSITTTVSGDFIWALSWNESNNTVNAGTGYTLSGQDTTIGGSSEGKTQASSGAIQATFTNAAGFGNNITAAAAFKAAAGGGPAGCKNGILLMGAGCEF